MLDIPSALLHGFRCPPPEPSTNLENRRPLQAAIDPFRAQPRVGAAMGWRAPTGHRATPRSLACLVLDDAGGDVLAPVTARGGTPHPRVPCHGTLASGRKTLGFEMQPRLGEEAGLQRWGARWDSLRLMLPCPGSRRADPLFLARELSA